MVTGETFIVDDEHKLDGRSWWELRPYMMRLPPKTWAETKKWIITICKKYKCKDSEIGSWDRSTKVLDTFAEKAEADVIIP